MDAHTYPGKGLSLSQLVFALSEELKHAAYSPSFTFDNVSQLDQDISTALANVREWRNSFLHINRVPLDVLSLIPTHLSLQGDRFRASFVCRHWRRTFLQHATLWSQLYLSKGEIYVKTLLERAKASTLDIISGYECPVGVIALFPPHTIQIRTLNFGYNHWTEIQRFSEVNSGPLPLLRALTINAIDEFSLHRPNTMTPPTLPLFSNAVNLKEFVLHSERSPFLSHFVLPNLTAFELSVTPTGDGFRVSELLDFLEASPMLRTVHMKVIANILLEGVPRERIVLLQDVETFSLVVNDGGPGYEIAARISCPSVRLTSFMHERDAGDIIPREVLPDPVSWNAIARQYTRSPVEEISLSINADSETLIECFLTFQFRDKTVLKFHYRVAAGEEDDFMPQMPLVQLHYEVFSQASRTIKDHPLVANVKRIHINHWFIVSGSNEYPRIADEARQLFKSVGPLEELTITLSDLYLYLGPPVDSPESHNTQQPVVLPQIKELNISHPLQSYNDNKRIEAIVGAVKSHHALGIPFERVIVRMENLPTASAERLRQWVGAVDCYEEKTPDIHY